MTFASLQPEAQRICRLVMDETARSMAGHPGFSLYLVGSRATGEAWPRSDFDFVIDAGEALPGRVINPLRENLEQLPIGYGIDLVTGIGVPTSSENWPDHKEWCWRG